MGEVEVEVERFDDGCGVVVVGDWFVVLVVGVDVVVMVGGRG